MKREAEEKALRDKLAGKPSGSTGGSAFAQEATRTRPCPLALSR